MLQDGKSRKDIAKAIGVSTSIIIFELCNDFYHLLAVYNLEFVKFHTTLFLIRILTTVFFVKIITSHSSIVLSFWISMKTAEVCFVLYINFIHVFWWKSKYDINEWLVV